MQPVQWKNIELEKTHRILKIEKKNDLIDISLNIAEDPEGGRRDFGGDCALERFVAVWGVHGKIGVALVHFSIYYCYPFSIFFFLKQFFCAVLVVVVVVCALNLIQRAGTGDENFSIQNLGAREGGGGLNGLN